MGTWPGLGFVNGQANRAAVFSKQLKAIEQPLRFALTQPGHGTMMRYQPFLALDDLQIPLSVEYLGLLDTVASVGFADIMPGADG
ncbi:hypothetical protein A244_39103, partial [Pseudomonas syringae pv. actinidiae ICMP 18807]